MYIRELGGEEGLKREPEPDDEKNNNFIFIFFFECILKKKKKSDGTMERWARYCI